MLNFCKATCLLALGAALSAPVTLAAQINVMTIGDSITWGLRAGASNNSLSNGGWRVPLNSQLNALPGGNTFNFIGIKGDGNATTVSGEKGGVNQNGDRFDGPGNATALHEGYSGWVIDAQPYVDEGFYNSDDFFNPDNDRSGIAQHVLTASNPTGTIDPGNLNGNFSGPADVIMLAIGINDVVGYTGYSSPYSVEADPIAAMVSNLGNLITTIATEFPQATLLVSNLLPVDKGLGSGTLSETNDAINMFNQLLLSQYFGDDLLDDSNGMDVYGIHDLLDNVFLLNVHSAIPTSPVGTALADGIHPNDNGYGLIADFYAARFEAGAFPIPEPGTAVLMVLGGAMVLGRRRRAA